MKPGNTTRRDFLEAFGLGAAAMALVDAEARAADPPDRPNVLMITCHDLGQHVGCYGVKTVDTRHIDALAARGVRFHNYFAAAPTCSPSRGVMLTGRYPQSNGLMGLTHAPWWWKLNEGERHLAAILTDAGYTTTLIGLQHVTQGDPKELGYQNVRSAKRVAAETVRAAKTFLKRAKPAGKAGKPFFAKVGFSEVHRVGGSYDHREPYTAKGVHIPPYLKDTEAIRDDLARFQADIRALDGCVGEILSALSASPVADNTLVIFTSDHGIAYTGAKWSLREAGLRIPLILWQSGTKLTGGKVFPQLMGNVDFLPTLLDLVGVKVPPNVEGVSFRGLIEGKTAEGPRKYVFAQRISHALRDNTSRSIRGERYKLIRYFQQGRAVLFPTDADPAGVSRHTARPKRRGGARPFAQLFDLEKDPHELHDIAAQPACSRIVKDLSRRLLAWMKQVNDPILKGPIATPYYRRSMRDFEEACSD